MTRATKTINPLHFEDLEPHIYVPFDREHGPFEPYVSVTLSTIRRFVGEEIYPKEENRIEFFPDEFPDPNTSKSETADKQENPARQSH